ncbi:MAG TPA: AEC family transporter [Actinomycetota bacterium]|nr:AEC family transporter [Actinomycetota bacterium]
MNVLDILSVLAPVFVVIGLGYFGGKRKVFDDHQIEGFNEFVLGFALPAMIFASVLATPRSVLAEDAILFLAVVLVQLVFLVLGVALGKTLLRQGLAAASIIGLLIAVPTAAFMGTPILDGLFSKASSSNAIALYAIATNVTVLPLSIVLLEWGTRPADEARSVGAILGEVLRKTISKTLVWSPLVALALVAIGVHVPSPFDNSLDLIGESTSAVALFAAGLILSRYRLHIGTQPVMLALLKNLAQPALMAGLALLFGITGVARSESVILTAMPASVVAPMFAVRYRSYEAESASTLIVGTALSIPTLVLIVSLLD